MDERTQPRTVPIEVAAKELGIGRSLAYQLANANQLPGLIRLGRRMVVSRAALDALLRGRDEPVSA